MRIRDKHPGSATLIIRNWTPVSNRGTAFFRTISKHGSPWTPQGDNGLETAGGLLRRAGFEPQHPRHVPGGPGSILQVQPPAGDAQGRTIPGGLLQGEESVHGTKINYEQDSNGVVGPLSMRLRIQHFRSMRIQIRVRLLI
jgi:hypothetical protein